MQIIHREISGSPVIFTIHSRILLRGDRCRRNMKAESLWGNACACSLFPIFLDLTKDKTFEVSNKNVKLPQELELEVDETDVEELIWSLGEELSNEGLIKLWKFQKNCRRRI